MYYLNQYKVMKHLLLFIAIIVATASSFAQSQPQPLVSGYQLPTVSFWGERAGGARILIRVESDSLHVTLFNTTYVGPQSTKFAIADKVVTTSFYGETRGKVYAYHYAVLGDPANYLVSVNMQTRTIIFGELIFNLTSN